MGPCFLGADMGRHGDSAEGAMSCRVVFLHLIPRPRLLNLERSTRLLCDFWARWVFYCLFYWANDVLLRTYADVALG